MKPVDVIVPVYDGYDETMTCLESIQGTRGLCHTFFRLLIIDDCSPNPDLSRALESFAEQDNVELIVNEKNLGFVGTVNRGMRYSDADVVLVNSDTEVANDWLDRMVQCVQDNPSIGTVTPFSNNAEICSFPVFCKSNELPRGISVQQMDALFSRTGGAAPIDIPTGVGFCMYITRACLDKVGYFDVKNFGRGYGEENDFCMRARAKGFRSVFCTNVFVYHSGGVSFGEEKLKRVERAMLTLDRLYPDYHEMVHDHIQQDPARFERLKAYIEYIRHFEVDAHKVLFVTHNLGGGTERHVRELCNYLGKRIFGMVLRAGQDGFANLSLGHDESAPYLTLQLPDDYPLLRELCRYLGLERVHCHHVMGVHPSVWGLLADLDGKLDITLHDYYFINANPTLTNREGDFCEDKLTRDRMCAERYDIPGHASPEFWRFNQHNFLRQADRIISPSLYTKNLYHEYFPDVTILPVYHPDWEAAPQYPPVIRPVLEKDEPLKVAVLGAISKEKGADSLDATARLAQRGDKVKFYLVGYAYRPLENAIHETGPYQEDQLEALIREINPHVIWFPCRWPETYSYTLSAALRSGLPVVAPDLGSFPERLHGRDLSWVMPWRTTPDVWLDLFEDIRQQFCAEPGEINHVSPLITAPSAFRYASNYLVGEPRPSAKSGFSFEALRELLVAQHDTMNRQGFDRALTDREKVLVWLLQQRSRPVIYHVLRLLPFNVMQSFKRSLTERPIHDVLTRYQQQGGEPVTLVKTVFPSLVGWVLKRRR